jgi:hypothetical protein
MQVITSATTTTSRARSDQILFQVGGAGDRRQKCNPRFQWHAGPKIKHLSPSVERTNLACRKPTLYDTPSAWRASHKTTCPSRSAGHCPHQPPWLRLLHRRIRRQASAYHDQFGCGIGLAGHDRARPGSLSRPDRSRITIWSWPGANQTVANGRNQAAIASEIRRHSSSTSTSGRRATGWAKGDCQHVQRVIKAG